MMGELKQSLSRGGEVKGVRNGRFPLFRGGEDIFMDIVQGILKIDLREGPDMLDEPKLVEFSAHVQDLF